VRFENRYSLLTLLFLVAAILTGCQKKLELDPRGKAGVEIRFVPEMMGAPVELGQEYTLPSGERFTPQVFKFYVGSIGLSQSQNSGEDPDQPGEPNHPGSGPVTGEPYHLIDISRPAEQVIRTQIQEGEYLYLEFLLGVDSARNVSGVQSGALDPLKGMFWTWNSGYIFAKLEGTSPQSTQPGNKVEYHIGGFRHPYNAAKTIRLPLSYLQPLRVSTGQTITMEIRVSLENWFRGAYDLRIADNAVCMTPGELAWSISQNFGDLFNITNLTIEE
jgi:hypothetical protein